MYLAAKPCACGWVERQNRLLERQRMSAVQCARVAEIEQTVFGLNGRRRCCFCGGGGGGDGGGGCRCLEHTARSTSLHTHAMSHTQLNRHTNKASVVVVTT